MEKTAEEILQEEAETATYIDENGEKQTGTVANDYIKAALGENNYYADTAGIYGKLWEDQKKENAAAAADADAATMAEVERQTGKTNAQYDKADKQLYRDYRTAVRDLPQQLAAMGITGGLSETSRVDLERGYGENLNNSLLQRLAAIGDIEAGGEEAKRQTAANLRQQNAAAAQNFLMQVIGLGGQKYADEQAKAQQGAEARASVGDFSGYVEMGLLTEEQAALMQKAWIAENPTLAKALGYVKASSGGYYEAPPVEVDWVGVAHDGMDAVKSGVSAEEVISDIGALYEIGAISGAGAKAAIQLIENQNYENVNKPASD